jgi:hypothetical protein
MLLRKSERSNLDRRFSPKREELRHEPEPISARIYTGLPELGRNRDLLDADA